jgi:hypothetical protein
VCRKLASTKPMDNNGLKCAIDHILEAEQKGEINEDNVLYIIENINVAGMHAQLLLFFFSTTIVCISGKDKRLRPLSTFLSVTSCLGI